MNKLDVKRLAMGPIGAFVKEVTCGVGANRVVEAFNMAVEDYADVTFCSREALDVFLEECKVLIDQLNKMNPDYAVIYEQHSCGDGYCIDLYEDPDKIQNTFHMVFALVGGLVTLNTENNESNL